MTIIIGQATVPSSSTVVAFRIPAGTVSTTIYQPTNPQQVFIGPSASVNAASGMLVPLTPLTAEQYVTSGGATIFATTGNATASSFSYIISTGSNL